jgi:hypothetical protein
MNEGALNELLERQARAMCSAALDAIQMRGVLREGEQRVPDFTVSLGRPDRLRIDAGGFAEGYDGRQSWEKPSQQPRGAPVSGPPADALRRAARWPSPIRSLRDCRDDGCGLALTGWEREDGRELAVVRMTQADGFARDYRLDAATGLILRSRDMRPLHPGQSAETIETWHEDYRLAAGICVAFRQSERSLDRGRELVVLEWQTVVANPELPAGLFEIP